MTRGNTTRNTYLLECLPREEEAAQWAGEGSRGVPFPPLVGLGTHPLWVSLSRQQLQQQALPPPSKQTGLRFKRSN